MDTRGRWEDRAKPIKISAVTPACVAFLNWPSSKQANTRVKVTRLKMKIAQVVAFAAMMTTLTAALTIAPPRRLRAGALAEEDAPRPPPTGGRLLEADGLAEVAVPRTPYPDFLADEQEVPRTPYPDFLADEEAVPRTPYPDFLADEQQVPRTPYPDFLADEEAVPRTPYPDFLADEQEVPRTPYPAGLLQLTEESVPGRLLRSDNVAEAKNQQQGARILASDGIEETADESWNVLLGDKKRRLEADARRRQ